MHFTAIPGCSLSLRVLRIFDRKGRSRHTIMVSPSDLERERKRGSSDSTLKMGLWKAAAPALFILDLIHPTITRTLCAYFVCRNLGSAGWFLEADYSVRCGPESAAFDAYTEEYGYQCYMSNRFNTTAGENYTRPLASAATENLDGKGNHARVRTEMSQYATALAHSRSALRGVF